MLNQFKHDIIDILENDPLNILDTKPIQSKKNKPNQILIAKFEEINDFFKEKGRCPMENEYSIHGKELFHRLKSIRGNQANRNILMDYDKFGILSNTNTDSIKKPEEINSIEDIYERDPLGLLKGNNASDSIFQFPTHFLKKRYPRI